MSTELAMRSSGLVGMLEESGLDMDLTDVMIPKIFLMQKMSEAVEEGKAKPGEVRDSIDNALLGNETNPLKISIVALNRTLVTYRNGEFESSEALTRQNVRLPWEEKQGADILKRQKCYNFTVLLPDKDCEGLPFVLQLKSTNSNAAKWINSKMLSCMMENKDFRRLIFELSVVKEKNDKGSWFVYQPKLSGELDEEMYQRVLAWSQKLITQEVRVDDGRPGDEI